MTKTHLHPVINHPQMGQVQAPGTMALSDCSDKSTIEKMQNISVPDISSLSADIPLTQREVENVRILIERLVSRLLAQEDKIAEQRRDKLHKLEKRYKDTSLEAADLQRNLGSQNLKFGLVTLASSFLQFLSTYESDRNIAQIFAKEVCPKFGEMYGSKIQADLSHATSVTSMLLQEYQAQTNNETSASSRKQAIEDVLRKFLDSLSRAAQSNG
jgi:hypothetical protein